MKRIILGLVASLFVAAPASAQYVTSPPLTANSGDQHITLTKDRGPYKAKDVLKLCKDSPASTYVKISETCPVIAPPAPPVEVINGASPKPAASTLNGRNGVLALDKCRPARIVGAYRLVETTSKSVFKNVTCSGLIGEGIKREGIRLRGTIENVTIENFSLIHEDARNVAPHLPEGLHVENGKNIVVRNGEGAFFRMVYIQGKYTNGDVFATERGVNGIRFENTIGRDSSDGCYDLKSYNTVLVNTQALRCSRNYRFWGTGTAESMTSVDAGSWHVGLYSATANWHIKKLVIRSTTKAAIFHSEAKGPGTALIVDDCDIIAPPGTKIFEGSKPETLRLAANCKIPS